MNELPSLTGAQRTHLRGLGQMLSDSLRIGRQGPTPALFTELNRQLEGKVAQISDANRELEAFSYSVSHDLRAPLRHISGFAAKLDRHLGDAVDDKTSHYLDVIGSSASRMAGLIDDLQRMDPDVAFGVPFGLLDASDQCLELREQLVHDAEIERQRKTDGRATREEQLLYLAPDPLGRQILTSANHKPAEGFSLFAIAENGDFEDVRLDEPFDMRAKGVERFIAFTGDRLFRFFAN